MLEDYPVITDIVVRWGDMDSLGHVNNILYLQYFETARIEYLLRLGVPSPGPGWRENGLIIKSVSCRFLAPVTFPDTLSVGARITHLGRDRALMTHAAVSQSTGELAATGDAMIVGYDYVSLCKNSFPQEIREAILALEGRELPLPPRRTPHDGAAG
ncbi:MAG: acyl-CoA thioesterase [Thermoleophilia bacterium]|nr:acyl-CoA thioesterase [Thermoleophilia bacterium]